MRGQTNRTILGPALQKRLRKAPTDAERHLWRYLRNRQLAGARFRRQHPFFDYILDFVCIEHRLVIEVDGGQHVDSSSDRLRDQRMCADGFRVLRFWNHEVLHRTHDVLEAILEAIHAHARHHPHPGPPLEGEGEQQESMPR